jgi:hypothetical protein
MESLKCGRDVLTLRARLLLYIRIVRLGRVYTLSTHVWSRDVPAGTVDTPPQKPNQAGSGARQPLAAQTAI